MTKEEIIEECKQRLGFETDCEMYTLCQHEKDFYNAIIEALEQPTMDKAMIHTLAKENDELKVEIGRLRQIPEQQPSDCVSLGVYNQVVWERDIAIEQLKELGYELGEKIRTDTDCVSREQALLQLTGVNLSNETPLELIALFDKRIKALQSVIPTHGRCKDCKHWKDSDGVYRREISAESKCPINIKEVYEGTFYCKDFEKRGSEKE